MGGLPYGAFVWLVFVATQNLIRRATALRGNLPDAVTFCALMIGLSAATAAAGGFRLVAKTGDVAPLVGGTGIISGLTGAEMNAQGDVLYSSSVMGPNISFDNNQLLVVSHPDGTRHVAAQTGTAVSGSPDGSRFTGFGLMMIGDTGSVAFEGYMRPLTTEQVSYDTLWRDSGGLQLVDSGRTNGSLLGSYTGTELRVDDMDHSGRVLYAKYSSNFSGSVLTFGHETWWLTETGMANRQIVTEGSSHDVPPAPPFTYSFIFDVPKLADNGRVVFAAQLTGSGIDTTNNDTVWVDDHGSKQILFRDGQAALGLTNGVVFTQVRDSISDAVGQIAFKATIGGPGVDGTNSKTLFSNAGGTLHLVARQGQSVLGIGTLSDAMHLDDIAGASTGFAANFSTTDGGNGNATFAEENGTLRTIVRSGQPAPGISGYTFSSFGDLQAVPGSDRFVVQSEAYRVNSESLGGVWIENESFSLIPLLVGGSKVQLGDAMKTVQWVWNGKFNTRGELPLTVIFTDGTSAVVVWDGKLSSLTVPGDYNNDGQVNTADYTIWRDTLGSRTNLREW